MKPERAKRKVLPADKRRQLRQTAYRSRKVNPHRAPDIFAVHGAYMREVFERATPGILQYALPSYQKFHDLCWGIAEHWGYAGVVGAAVFAALSPNNDYFGNLRDANKLIESHRNGKTIDQFTVSTYGQNKRKAWAIVNGSDPYRLIVADKTRNFFLNIVDPKDPVPVTIDGHMYNIWLGDRRNLVGLSLPGRLYDRVAATTRQLAADVNLIPNQVQSVLWWTWRQMHNIQTSKQSEMWDVEKLHAGLGWHQ